MTESLAARIPLLVLVTAAVLEAQQAPTPATLRETVQGAVAWIARQAVPVRGVADAVAFPSSEGSRQPAETFVYGGAAGILILLENAAAVLDDAKARALADQTANGLLAARRTDSRDHVSWTRGSMSPSGLYTGDAGIGQAFLVRHALRADEKALATAVEIGDALIARARTDGDTLSFDTQDDIIFGNAGTALFLLELAQASGGKRFLEAAQKTGHGLLAAAERVPSTADPARRLPTWPLHLGAKTVHMPNFSHGTAGVSYALARIAAATGDQDLLAGAKDGAQWLLEHAVADGNGLKWPARDPGDTCMGGWCHGPAGTGRLFLLLAALTGEARYREAAVKGARFVVDYADRMAAGKGADGKPPYVPPSFCCGVAGVIDYFCDLQRITHDPADAAFARKAGSYLIEVAVQDGDGRKWKNGQSVPGGPVAADTAGFNVDLMLGAAGEALALLRLLTLEQPVDPVRGMPDRAVSAGPAASPPRPR